MKIAEIEVIPVRIPLERKVSFATGSLSFLEHVVVRVRSEDGIVGTAEAPSRPMVYGESVLSIMAAIKQWFAPPLIGKVADDEDFRRSVVSRFEQNHTAKGALDMACHDLVARSLNLPLCRLLGGGSCTEVEVSHILGIGPVEAVTEEATRYRESYGIKTFKLKAGLDPRRDTALIAGIRRNLGDEIRITVDCNHGYDAQTARATLPQWEEYDVAWVEEPCPARDPISRRAVAAVTRLPLMADESTPDVPQVVEELHRGDCRFVSIKPARGGYSRSKRIVHLCEAHDVSTVIGSQGDTDLGSLTSAHFQAAHSATARYPGELSFFLEAKGGLLTEPPVIRAGKYHLPDGIGHGGMIDEDALKHFRSDN
jgi:L-alanine-DL-glutamate epimerase-like enolase superfamily enzyme